MSQKSIWREGKLENARRLLKGKRYSQDDLIPLLILVIRALGGVATKNQVDSNMYTLLDSEFSQNVYNKTVSHGVPRWQHDIAWAKERARQNLGYVMSAEDAGWGTWQLTEKGNAFANSLAKKIESSVRIIRRKKVATS